MASSGMSNATKRDPSEAPRFIKEQLTLLQEQRRKEMKRMGVSQMQGSSIYALENIQALRIRMEEERERNY